jgi:hypothetical protein
MEIEATSLLHSVEILDERNDRVWFYSDLFSDRIAYEFNLDKASQLDLGVQIGKLRIRTYLS